MPQVAEIIKDLPADVMDWQVWIQEQSIEVLSQWGTLGSICLNPRDLAEYNKTVFRYSKVVLAGAPAPNVHKQWVAQATVSIVEDLRVPRGKARLIATF